MIPIIMNVDENYISQVKVAIYSACKATNNTEKLLLTILCSRKLPYTDRYRIQVLEDVFPNLRILFHEIDDTCFDGVKDGEWLTVAAYYRLLAANILNYDKCIYLDGDILVKLDLRHLYSIDIEDFYCAGSLDMNLRMSPNRALEYSIKSNMPDFSDYINTGVLLLNLKKIREDALVAEFMDQIHSENNPWCDQDIINRVCHGSIKVIGWNFNRIMGYSDELYEIVCGTNKEKCEGRIMHWAGLFKPWIDFAHDGAEEWWNTAEEVLEQDIYRELCKKAQDSTNKIYVSYIVEECKKKKRVVIFGYSDNGMRLMCMLRRMGVSEDIIFCDNDIRKSKLKLVDNEVVSVEEAVKSKASTLYVIAIQNTKDINIALKQLLEQGVNKNSIVIYHNLVLEEYLFMNEKCREKGLNERIIVSGY